MKMTDKLAADLLDYIEKTPKLYDNLQYLYNYRYTGFENCVGKTIGDIIYNTNGWIGLCKTEIFLEDIPRYYGESEEELVERLSMYAINYLTCVAALDMFVGKFKGQVFNAQLKATMANSGHALYNNMVSFMICPPTGGWAIEEVYFTIEPDDYKLVSRPLDLHLKIDVARYERPGFGQWHIKVNELSKDRLEEMMLAAGW